MTDDERVADAQARPMNGHELLEEAWDELHAATPPGWFVGRPEQRHGGQWAMYAFDTTEKAHIGRRSREWTAVAQTEDECVREMARCLRKISEGKAPR